MATGVQPSKFINYISQFKKVLVTRNNGVITQTFKIDSSIDDNYYFSIVNSNNQLISLEGRVFRIYGSLIDTKEQMHILFYSDRCTIENGTQMHFKIETYTSQYMSWVKSKRIIDLTIVEVANPDAPEEEQTTQVVLRDEAIAYKRPYIENQTPTEILQKVILTTNVPLTGAFGSGHDIDLTIGSDGAAFGTGLKQTGDNQLVIGQYNEADATKAFVIGNGEDNSNRSNVFTVDYQGNVEANSINATSLLVDGEQVATGSDLTGLATKNELEAVSAAIPSVEGFATEQWVLDKGYITGVNLDPYATKDQLTAYATKTDLTVSASVLSNQISQLALNIPTKVSDLTNDAGYLTAVPSSYALKTDIPTGNAQLQNTAGYITGYNAGTGISISNGTISLTGEVGKTYYADNNTLQLNNSTNTFSIKSLSSKLNQGANILLTPQSDGSVTINAIGGGGGGTGGATYLAGLGLSLSTVSAEDAIYKFYVNESWLDNKINTATSGIQNLSAGTGLKIEDNVISLTAEIPSIDGLASEQWVEANFLSAIPSNYATKDYVDSSVSGKADLSSVYTKEEVYTYIETDAKINQATSGKADKSEVQAVDDKFDNYYTSAQVDQAIAAAVEDIPSTVYTGEDGIKVENGVISLTATLSSITNDAGFITSADIPTSYVQQSELESVSGQLTNAIGAKANTTDVEAEFTATSAWANETFLTEHQSLDNYYNKTEVDTALALKADSTDVYTKTEVNNISTNIVSQIPTDVATSAYVQAASGNAVNVATGWVQDKNYLSSINVIQQDTDFDENTSKLFFNTGFSLAQTEDMVRVDIDTNSIATQEYVNGQVSGKADQSTVEGLSTALSTAIDTKANSADVYTKSQVYTKGETDTAINTATSGKVNKTDFDTVTGALSSVIDSKVTSGEVKTQIEAYGYQNATDVANAISGKADKSELQSVSGTLNTAIGGVSDRVGAIEADYTTSAQVSNIVTGYDYISAITVINEYQQFEENTKKLTFDTGFGLTQTEDTVRIELDVNYVATVDALSSVSGTLTGQISAVDTKATNNTNSINALTGRVKAIEDDYTTSAYVTGQVNNLATGAVATNTTNIGQLSTKLDTVSSSVPTSVYQIATAGSGITISEQGEIALIWNTIPSAVSQLINDVGFVTEAGGGGTGIEYYGGYGISVNGAEISLTATIPTAISDLTNDSNFATSAQVSAIVTGYNYLTGITIEDAYEQTSHVSSLVLTDDFSYYDQLYWNGLLVDNQAGQGGGEYRAKKLVFSNDFNVNFGDEVSEISINSDILSSYATKNELQTTSASIVALIPTVPTNIGAFTNDVGYLTAVPTSYVQQSELTAYAEKSQIPTKTSDLTNDSNFATSAYVQSASGNAVDVATGWVQEQDYAKYDDIGSVVQGYGYQTAADVQNAIGSSSGAIVQAATGAITVPTKTSDLTNDSGFITASDIPAAPSTVYDKLSAGSNITLSKNEQTGVTTIAATGGGGGGGTTYTAGDGIDITNDEISVKLSGGNNVTLSTDSTGLVTINATGGGSAGNIVGGAGIRVMQDGGNTIISIATASLIATPTAYTFDFRNTSGTVDFDYTSYTGNQNLIMSYQGTLPNGITASPITSGYQFEYVSGANVSNTTSTITAYFDAYDITQPTSAEVQINTIGFVNAEISASTITSFVFDANNAETISAFTWNVVSGTPQNLTVEISGDLPDGVTSALSIQNRTLTFSATSESLTQNGTKAVNVVIDGDNIERQVIALELTVQNAIIRTPLTFVGKDNTNAVKLTKIGNPHQISLQYSKNGGEWTTYNIEDIIEFGNEETVAFKGNNSAFNVGYNNQYQFVMTGIIDATGNIQSLMGYSDTVADNCYYRLFRQCNSMRTAPQLPAMNLANSCYRFMFNECANLITAPSLPATTLVQQCYDNMFFGCSNLTGCPNIAGTNPANNSCQSMFQSCPKFSYVKVNFTNVTMNVNSSTNLWLNNAASTGTVVCPTSLTINTRSDSTVPQGWTIERF